MRTHDEIEEIISESGIIIDNAMRADRPGANADALALTTKDYHYSMALSQLAIAHSLDAIALYLKRIAAN